MDREMPTLAYEWEKKVFNDYFRFALKGATECTVWDYWIHFYRFQYMETLFFAFVEIGVFICLLCMNGTTVPESAFNLNLIVFTGLFAWICQNVVRVKKTRAEIMNFWKQEKAKEQNKGVQV